MVTTKRAFIRFSVALLVVFSALRCQETSQEISASVAESKTLQRDAQKRIDEAQHEQDSAQTSQERKDAELQQEEARNDLYTAQLQEQRGVLELANQQKDTQKAQRTEEQIATIKEQQQETQKKIDALSQQLAQEFVTHEVTQITSASELLVYAQSLEIGGYSDTVVDKKREYLDAVSSKIEDFFGDALVNEVTQQPTLQDTLTFLDDKRMSLEALLDTLQREHAQLETWSQGKELSQVVQAYKQQLDTAISFVTQEKASLDVMRVSTEVKNVGLLSKIVSSIKAWFDATFQFNKAAPYSRSIDKELATLQNIQTQVSKMQQGDIGSFVDRVDDLRLDVSTLKEQFENYKAGIESLDSEQFQANIDRFQKSISSFDVAKLQSAVALYNQLYTESLQPLMGDVSAKLHRYKDPQFATLFAETVDFYESKSIFGGTTFKAQQAYQALFTPEVIATLNKQNPDLQLTRAMFDPVSFDSSAISPELVDKAYAVSRDLYTQQDPVWRAARNASFLLRNPVSRVTYDAFLQDYKSLLALGIQDPLANSTDQAIRFLNGRGALSQLQITQATKEQIQSFLINIVNTISKTKTYFDEVALGISRVSDVQQEINTLNVSTSSFMGNQQQNILNGN